jgi:hypothetical protein
MSTVLERGDVFFFYRPRVDATEVDELEDVQRFFFVLKPDRKRRYREIVVGRKRLPDPAAHEREWAFVARVVDDADEMRGELEAKAYETKTRGVRVEPQARPAGEARYAIVDHDGHTHFAYALELPPEPGEVQRTFRIEREASHVVAARNPDAPAPEGAGLPERERPTLPPELMERFGRRRFAPLDPPELLDYVHVEIVLIGASEHAGDELGIDLDAEQEQVENADVFRKLRLRPDDVPLEPLVRGDWR